RAAALADSPRPRRHLPRWGEQGREPHKDKGCRGRLVTAAPAATAAVTTPAPAGAAAAAALGLWPGLVDGQGPALHLLEVQRLDGGLGFGVAAHLDEAEALGATRVPVHDDLG